MRTLQYGGRLITSEAAIEPNPESEIIQIVMRQLDIIGSSSATSNEVEELYAYVWDGTVKLVIQETIP